MRKGLLLAAVLGTAACAPRESVRRESPMSANATAKTNPPM